MINRNQYFKLFENCKMHKGYCRSIIYELDREKMHLIPNELYSIFNKFSGSKISVVFRHFKQRNRAVLLKYFKLLMDSELIIVAPTKDQLNRFKDIGSNIEFSTKITNCVIYDKGFSEIKDMLLLLMGKGCFNYHIRISGSSSKVELFKFIEYINCTAIMYIEIFFEFDLKMGKDEVIQLSKKTNKFITLFTCRDMSDTYQILNSKTINLITFSKSREASKSECAVTFNSLNINNSLYFESLVYNTFFNNKLILKNRKIILHPDSNKNFGEINEKNIRNFLNSQMYNTYRYITKDKINVCKDCEFKMACVDNRLPKKTIYKRWYYETECNYNPYVSKWKGEKGYLTLKECKVVNTKYKFYINRKEISRLKDKVWSQN